MGELIVPDQVVIVIGPNANQIFGVYRNWEVAEWDIEAYREDLMKAGKDISQYNFITKREYVLG